MRPLAGEHHALDSARGWRTVAVAFVSMFTVFGVAYSFGAFFKPMADEFGSSRSAISFVFSITACLYFLLGGITGPAVDRVGPRRVLLVGALVMGAGLLLTSRVQHLWVGYFTYGVGVGVGVACGYVPMVAVVGGWFERRRSTAIGVAVAGIGLGTLVASPVAAALIERIGWRHAYVAFGLTATVVLCLCAWWVTPPPRSPEAHVAAGVRTVEGSALRSREFAVLYGSAFLMSLALFVVLVHLVPYAQDHGVAKVKAASLVSVVGGASIVGRLGLSALGDRVGRVRVYALSFAVMAASLPLWLVAGRAFAVMVIFAVVMGAGYGGFIALSPAVAAELFGTRGMGQVVGTLYTSAGIGALVGPPLAGLIIDHAGYRPAILAALALAVAATAALLPLRPIHRTAGA